MRYLLALAFVAPVIAPTAASAQNLIPNPHFDTADLSPWTPSVDLVKAWVADDVGADPASGSMLLTNSRSGQASVAASDCVPITPGQTYRMTAFVTQPASQAAAGNIAYIALAFDTSIGNCNGTQLSNNVQMLAPPLDGTWLPANLIVVAPATAHTAEVKLGITKPANVIELSVDFDDIFFGDSIFADDFDDPATAQR